MWRLWAKALGQKEGKDKKDADKVALIRTLIMLQLVTTNGFIIANAVRHWNNVPDQKCHSALDRALFLCNSIYINAKHE